MSCSSASEIVPEPLEKEKLSVPDAVTVNLPPEVVPEYFFLVKKSIFEIVFALIAVCGGLNNNDALAGSLIEAQPVVADLESASMLPANAMYKPPFATKDSAAAKSDSMLNVFDDGINGNEDSRFKVAVFELVIRIGASALPAPFVILKYIFAYAFVVNEELNVAGMAIVVGEEPEAARVPVIGTLFAPNV